MIPIDIDGHVGEVAAEPPCGPDLSYDADFLALDNAARGKTEQQFGATVIAAEPPDWREVEKRAAVLLGRSKDIRIAVALCRAWVNIRGLPGLAAGVSLVVALLERYWDQVHPLPEDGDHYMRMNAVSSLDEVTGLIRDLRTVDFLRSTAGMVTVRDAEALVRGNAPEAGSKLSLSQLRNAVAQALLQGNETIESVSVVREALSRLLELWASNAPGQSRPALDQLQSTLRSLHELIPAASAAGLAHPDTQAQPPVAGQPGETHRPGLLRTRDDALAQLLAVADFIEKTEPTNPAPLLIRRAARLMQMGFIDILRELSPESLTQVETIMGGVSQQ